MVQGRWCDIAHLRYWALLSGKGGNLETSVRSALELMGFDTCEYKDEQHQFDAVFEADGQRYVGECEGRDNKQVDVGRLSQAMRCVAEDLALREVGKVAIGVLFGNGQRLLPLGERSAAFTDKVLAAAKQQGIRLIETPDLFRVTLAIRDGAGPDFAERCRNAIKESTGGLVVFPTE